MSEAKDLCKAKGVKHGGIYKRVSKELRKALHGGLMSSVTSKYGYLQKQVKGDIEEGRKRVVTAVR